jgi:hypothetical protein
MNETNTKEFLFTVLEDLKSLPTALFGGWAEEILGLTPNRPHSDVDLLLASENFVALDDPLSADRRYSEITEKRFSHKRAYEKNGVRIEIFLVHPTPSAQPSSITSASPGLLTLSRIARCLRGD